MAKAAVTDAATIAPVRSGLAAVDRYLETGYATVPGMSSRFAAAICCGLLRMQSEMGVVGPVVEIGPFEDASLSPLRMRWLRARRRWASTCSTGPIPR